MHYTRQTSAVTLLFLFSFAAVSCLLPTDEDTGVEPVGVVESPLLSGTALYVASSSLLGSADSALRSRLQTLGLTVVVRSASASQTADANGKVLVVISSTVTPSSVGTKFRTVAVPVLSWESQLFDDLGMTPTTFGSFGTQSLQRNLAISAASHPIAAGLSGTVAVSSSSSTFNWGKPNANATRIATLTGDTSRAAVFAYEAGAVMPGLTAPARRVGMFLGDSTASVLTANGGRLFDQAVSWAVGSGTTPGDSDNDRLADSVETNTGVFVNSQNTGTNPNQADTDGDGIADGDEVLGTTAGLNLPALGVSPVRKEILLEHDWFNDALDCGSHSHRPTPASLAKATTAFANAPVTNPDGSTGITLIHDYGQGGAFTGGNLIQDSNGVIDGNVFGAEFQNHKAANFASNRLNYFHYVLLPHRYDTSSASSGYAEIFGDDLIVSLYCFNTDDYVANTLVHELGHNLGLLHGGLDNVNYKPNYNSVMNYAYQFYGVDTDCTPPGDSLLDLSRNARIPLDENALLERNGICGPNTTPWDWNGNGMFDTAAVQVDANGDAAFSTLQDYDDWANVRLNWRATGLISAQAQREFRCDNPVPTTAQTE